MKLLTDLTSSALRLKGPQRPSRWRDHILAFLFMSVCAVLLSAAIVFLSPSCKEIASKAPWRCAFPYFLGLGPFFGLPFIPVAVLALWSMRDSNFGGYVIAMAIGAILASIGDQLLLADATFLPLTVLAGSLLGVFYWTALFLLCRTSTSKTAQQPPRNTA